MRRCSTLSRRIRMRRRPPGAAAPSITERRVWRRLLSVELTSFA
jgi:hypothetical protein